MRAEAGDRSITTPREIGWGVSLESFWKAKTSANSQLLANLGDGCEKDNMIVFSRVNAQVIPVDSGFPNGLNYLSQECPTTAADLY